MGYPKSIVSSFPEIDYSYLSFISKGLSAFNHLSSIGLHNVQIFEASNRVGGRVYPLEFGKNIFKIILEYFLI